MPLWAGPLYLSPPGEDLPSSQVRFGFNACVSDLTGVHITGRLGRGAGSVAVHFVMVSEKKEKEANVVQLVWLSG